MKTTSFILVCLIVLGSGCKKSPELTEPIESPVPTPISCVCLEENIGSPVLNDSACNVFLQITTQDNVTTGNSIYLHNVYASAFFYPQNTTNGTATAIKVDTVLLNNQTLPLMEERNFPIHYYRSNITAPQQQKWSINGANGIPSFTTSLALKYPDADFSQVPDTISISQVKSFKVTGVNNCTYATVVVHDRSGMSNPPVVVKIHEGSNDVCLPEKFLKTMGQGKAEIQITLYNNSIQTFNSNNISFSTKLLVFKDIMLEP